MTDAFEVFPNIQLRPFFCRITADSARASQMSSAGSAIDVWLDSTVSPIASLVIATVSCATKLMETAFAPRTPGSLRATPACRSLTLTTRWPDVLRATATSMEWSMPRIKVATVKLVNAVARTVWPDQSKFFKSCCTRTTCRYLLISARSNFLRLLRLARRIFSESSCFVQVWPVRGRLLWFPQLPQVHLRWTRSDFWGLWRQQRPMPV